ncbi:MAG: ribonuclease J [Patescibacteria group bacterium]
MSLRFIAISGTTDVTENCYLYESDHDMIMVDCGVGFPDPGMYGVDLVIPDFTYVLANKNKLKGIIISHGHEDHIGAIPFLLKELRVPVYSTKLVAGFIEDKLLDFGIKDVKVNVFDPEKDTIALGAFKITPFRVSHSVPDGVGFCIDTSEGKLFHVPDYKFDWTPVDGRPFDVKKAAILASGGALALASDALGSNIPGHTASEAEIEEKLLSIMEKARGQVFFSTISSNISRVQQALNVAKSLGRKTVFIGRSIDKKAQIARRLGYLFYDNNQVVSVKQADKLDVNQVMYVVSGSYGQPGSALYRISVSEHEYLKAEMGDTVIFSGDPAPPGSKANVDFVVDRFFELGVDVHYYDIQEDLHVSGHGSQEDIKALFGLISPKYFIPIGGTIRHMKGYSKIAQDMGAKPEEVFELKSGEVIEFKDKNARISERIPVRDVLVDGLGIGDVGNVVLRDRHVLSKEGIAIVILQVDRNQGKLFADPEVLSRGFVFEGTSKDLLIRAGKELKTKIDSKGRIDSKVAKDTTVDFLEKFFFTEIGRRPMVLPVVVEV